MSETIRPASLTDLPDIWAIIRRAQELFKQAGIDQWQKGYPDENTLEQDIALGRGHLLENQGRVLAYFALCFDGEPNYTHIENGAWLTNGPFSVLHRLAVREEVRRTGAAGRVFDYWEAQTRRLGLASMRADTHPDNLPMQNLLRKRGFTPCGIIYVCDGGARVAFEKPLS